MIASNVHKILLNRYNYKGFSLNSIRFQTKSEIISNNYYQKQMKYQKNVPSCRVIYYSTGTPNPNVTSSSSSSSTTTTTTSGPDVTSSTYSESKISGIVDKTINLESNNVQEEDVSAMSKTTTSKKKNKETFSEILEKKSRYAPPVYFIVNVIIFLISLAMAYPFHLETYMPPPEGSPTHTWFSKFVINTIVASTFSLIVLSPIRLPLVLRICKRLEASAASTKK